MSKRPSSSSSHHRAHLTSPKIAQANRTGSSEEIFTNTVPNEIENDKDFIKTTMPEKSKQKPWKKTKLPVKEKCPSVDTSSKVEEGKLI